MKKYDIYTDASFDKSRNIATYAIVVKEKDKVLKSFSKRSKTVIKNSTEIEIFAVYQAMKLILSCYISKKEKQSFCINTDCLQVLTFFKNKKMKIFKHNENLKKEMLKVYKILSRKKCIFTLKWISRKLNKLAHKQTHNMMKRLREIGNSKEDFLISKEAFYEILSKFSKNQNLIIVHLLSISNEEGIIFITQKEIAKSLNLSISTINKTFNKMKQIKILEKVRNGKYITYLS